MGGWVLGGRAGAWDSGCDGAVVGGELYEGRFSLGDAAEGAA